MNRNTTATKISSNIFHNSEKPKKTSEGIVVINAIGMITLKNILREKENELRGNLPIYKNDLILLLHSMSLQTK